MHLFSLLYVYFCSVNFSNRSCDVVPLFNGDVWVLIRALVNLPSPEEIPNNSTCPWKIKDPFPALKLRNGSTENHGEKNAN